MDTEKYKNSKRRILASIIDGVMLSLPPVIVFANIKIPNFVVYFSNVYMIVPVAYFVICNYLYGQTLGKNVLELKVVDNKSEGRISLKQSILREAPWVVLTGLTFSGFILYYILGVDSTQGFYETVGKWNYNFGTYWWLLEIITMLTNTKQRAVHDFIAGTVVVRLTNKTTADTQLPLRPA